MSRDSSSTSPALLSSPPQGFYRKYGKRLFDIVMSVVLFVLLLPALLGAAAIVLVFIGRPILFRQERPGLHGRSFMLNKFRTLRIVEDSSVDTPDQERLTQVGAILRRTHLDELPQLFNVLVGDMSLVGPRPLLVEYLSQYTPVQAQRHEVLPGITGLAQVRGGNQLPWSTRFKLDVWYVDHISFRLDLYILALTFINGLKLSNLRREALFSAKFTDSEP